MLASISGQVVAVALDSAVINVGGLGVRVQATPSALATLEVGKPGSLHTVMIVREDSISLVGFPTADETDVFRKLISVSGIGPRIALAILAVHSPDALRSACANSDEAALTRVPGIGKKSAQRIILEIGDKLGAPGTPGTPAAASGGTSEVIEALVGLGWPEKTSRAAVERVSGADNGPEGVPALLRAALKELGASRG